MIFRPHQARTGWKRAFTLVEIMISVSLLAILATMLFLILDATAKLWRETEKRIDSYRQARVALNLIARELRSFFPLDPTLADSFIHNTKDASPTIQLPAGAITPPTADSLFFTATLPAGMQDPDKDKSDLCAVGYYLAWTKDAGSSGISSLKLYRHFKSSDDVFAALTASTSPKELYASIGTNVNGQNDILARNILSLKITPYERDTATGLLTPLTSWPANKIPGLVEITIQAINTETAAKLRTQTDWDPVNSPFKELIAANTQTFTTRVAFPANRAPAATPTPTP